MKKRIQLDLFLDDLSKDDIAFLKSLKAKSKDINENEKSIGSYHDCGHDEGKPCINKVKL